MRFLISGSGWPVGQYLIPPGEIIDHSSWQWNGIPLPWPPPRDCQPLDGPAYEVLRRNYPEHLLLRPPPEMEN